MLYFDYNATTPVAPEVAEELGIALRDCFGNASSTHSAGQAARNRFEQARRIIAARLGIAPTEIVFTSGGTEADNLAILGCARNIALPHKHAITSEVEHPAVLESFRQLKREGVEVSYVPVDRNGVVSVDEVTNRIQPDTVLVSIMHANNETGVIQPIEAIAAEVRSKRAAGQPIYFHSDGVQAFGKIALDITDIDLYSITAHKIYGPKGIGALSVRKQTPIGSIQFGGRHERGRRPGTENIPGALAFARAAELCNESDKAHLATLREQFESQLSSAVTEIAVNGAGVARLPNTSSITFHGVSGEGLLIALDLKGIAVSAGSACSSGALEPSHVLLAMGLTREAAKSTVRFSFGRYNRQTDIDRLVNEVTTSVQQLRRSRSKETQLA